MSAIKAVGIIIPSILISVGKPEEKRPLGRPRHKWEDNIKMDLRQERVVWTGLVWLRTGVSGGFLQTW
jgi:hypothetical protein